jgi:hypothetical protein
MTPRRRTLAVLLTLGAGLLASLTALPAAQAATGSAPVTQPDAAGSVYPGNVTFLVPLANDTDPDGDELAICRLGTEKYKGIRPDYLGVDFAIAVGPKAKPGTYTFTYYACDFSYLTPGTITVTVEEALDFTVKKIDGRPGKLKVTNGAPFTVRFLYGSFEEEGPDGTLRIKRGESVVITVHRTRIDWIATSRNGEIFVGSRSVLNIKLPPGDGPPAQGRTDVPAAVARAWHGV